MDQALPGVDLPPATMLLRVFPLTLLLCPFVCGAQQDDHSTGGAFPSKEDILSIPWESPFEMPKAYRLPATADLSPWFPPAGDQYEQASCSGWALGYGLSTYQWNKLHDQRSDTAYLGDPANVFSPAFVYDLVALEENIDSCTKGVQLPDAVRLVCNTGCATWMQFPFDTTTYHCLRAVPDSVMIAARRHRMSHPVSLDNRDYTQWRYHLSKGRPIIFFVTIGPFFEQGFLTDGDKPFVWDEPFPDSFGPPREGHIMVCTGYDEGHLIALNSWGEHWGERGYVRIPDSTMYWACSDAYILQAGAPLAPLKPPTAVDDRDLGKDGRTNCSMGKGQVYTVDSIMFRVVDDARAEEPVIEILDAGTLERVHTLCLREDQPSTLHHEGCLYTFTFTGRRWPGKRPRISLVKNDPAQLQCLQRELDTIDKHCDGVVDGRWED